MGCYLSRTLTRPCPDHRATRVPQARWSRPQAWGALPVATLVLSGAAGASLAGGQGGTGVLLPDGREFVSWEQPLRFTKTYYVDNQNARAADSNPGTKASSADRRLCGPRLFSGTPGEQAHGADEISIRTESTPQPRHGATLRRCGNNCDGTTKRQRGRRWWRLAGFAYQGGHRPAPTLNPSF